MEDWSAVTGLLYQQACDNMRITEELIDQRENKGFANREEALEFAENIHCMLRAYSPALHGCYYVNHVGELQSGKHWYEMYANVLFYKVETEKKVERVVVAPERYTDVRQARALSEIFDGLRQPLYHRNYFLPKGTYDEVKGTFNVARPFRYFAKQTGADTSHIYELLKHIAGVNYIYVLAWLREKMMNPTKKTEVVPVFIGQQGTGKSTFGEAICMAMFEENNVIVSDQFDASARFNNDYADALIVCMEEKKQDDKRNDANTIKSRVTASHIRKEQKGIDPIYQESYTDFIMTSNNDVTVKFDSPEQRRFMVMEVDAGFTRANPLADEVFTKLYGYDGNGKKVGTRLIDDGKTIEQFKWELLNNKQIAETSPRDFIKTEAYERQFSMPRTNEAVEVEAIIRTLAPYIKASLVAHQLVTTIIETNEDGEQTASDLLDVIRAPEGIAFFRKVNDDPDRFAVNRMVVFNDEFTGKPFAHSVVDRGLQTSKKWLREEYGLALLGRIEPPASGFKGISSRYKMSPCAWFVLTEALKPAEPPMTIPIGLDATSNVIVMEPREGVRVRYSDKTFLPDPHGVFETLNELLPGAKNRSKENCAHIDTFLLEADETSGTNKLAEERILKTGVTEIRAPELYMNRLRVQHAEAKRLFDEGVVCRVVYSGAKSLHMLVRVDPPPLDLKERRWLFAYLCKTLSQKLVFDPSVGDPGRLTRAPIITERVTYSSNGVKIIGMQEPVLENWANVYRLQWRPMYEAWCNQPKEMYEQKGISMLPTKDIYRDAARAFMEGTFFTDPRWNGKRQECFFPLYRIVRALGYTFEQVWDEVREQVKEYPKIDERAYWVSREDCDLIRQIEGDLV